MIARVASFITKPIHMEPFNETIDGVLNNNPRTMDTLIFEAKIASLIKLLSTAMAVLIFFWMVTVISVSADDETEPTRDYKQFLNETFQSGLVYPQDKWEVQLALEPSFSEGDERDIIQIPFALEYGITDNWQVNLEWDAHVHRDPNEGSTTRGIGDLELGTQYSFMNLVEPGGHAALAFEIGWPVGDVNQELSEGFLELSPSLLLAKDFAEFNNSQIFTEIGVSFVDRVNTPDDPDEVEPEAHEFFWNIGFFIPLGNLRLVTEFNWTTNEWNNNGTENNLFITPGVFWDLPDGWELGLGIPVGLNDESDNYRVITKLIYEFDILG